MRLSPFDYSSRASTVCRGCGKALSWINGRRGRSRPPIRLYPPAPAPLPHAAEIALIYLKSRLGGPHAPYGLRLIGKPREENNAQIDRCGRLRLINCNFGTSHDACTASSAGQHGDANCSRLRPGQNAYRWRMRGTDDRAPDPPRRPQMRAMAGRRLRFVSVSALDWRWVDPDRTPVIGSWRFHSA